jgi:O-antigen/teichoic acid export membrane protein
MDRNLAQASKFRKIFLYSLLGLLASLVLILLLGGIPTLLLYGSGVAAVMSLVAWIAALIANQAALKGRSWANFFVLSIFFPFIMWIVVSVMTTDQSQPISGTKKCPKCAEYVKAEATLCKHCGSSI